MPGVVAAVAALLLAPDFAERLRHYRSHITNNMRMGLRACGGFTLR